MPEICTFTAQRPLMSTHRFQEINPEIWHTCSVCPCRTIDERFLFFVAEKLASFMTQISQNETETEVFIQ